MNHSASAFIDSGKDPYKLLGVTRDATPEAIKKAYRALARRYHPDVNPGDKTAETNFKEVQNAYDILSDPETREHYDRSPKTSAAATGSSFTSTNPKNPKKKKVPTQPHEIPPPSFDEKVFLFLSLMWRDLPDPQNTTFGNAPRPLPITFEKVDFMDGSKPHYLLPTPRCNSTYSNGELPPKVWAKHLNVPITAMTSYMLKGTGISSKEISDFDDQIEHTLQSMCRDRIEKIRQSCDKIARGERLTKTQLGKSITQTMQDVLVLDAMAHGHEDLFRTMGFINTTNLNGDNHIASSPKLFQYAKPNYFCSWYQKDGQETTVDRIATLLGLPEEAKCITLPNGHSECPSVELNTNFYSKESRQEFTKSINEAVDELEAQINQRMGWNLQQAQTLTNSPENKIDVTAVQKTRPRVKKLL